MASHPGVLIVSASTGTGHTRAGEALKQAFAERDPAFRIEHVDLLDLTPGWVRAAYGDGFEMVVARAPWLWRELYRRTEAPDGDPARWGPVAQRLLFREFHRLLLSVPWQLCLCTHFLPSQLAAGHPGLPPFALVITDFTLHRYWAQPRVKRYFVATEALAEGLQILAVCGRNEAVADRLRSRGVPEERLRVFGYMNNIELAIAAADLVVTKPGGLTTSEALALGRPLLLTRPIPGQEEGNTRALTAAGAALEATNPLELRETLERVFRDPGVLSKLAGAARSMGRSHAAQTIVGAIRREYILDSAA